MPRTVQEIRVPDDGATTRADRIVQRATGLSRAAIRGLFDHGCVTIDDLPCDQAGRMIRGGSTLVLRFDPGTRYKEKPATARSPFFDLVFEDAHLVVVNKRAGILTVPAGARGAPTLVDEVRSYVRRGQARGRPVTVVHRLDRDTSGLLVFAKAPDVGARLKDQFAASKPDRVYVAIAAGRIESPTGTLRSHLATDRDLNQRSVRPGENGKLAITHYQVVQVLRDATLLRVTLETGRRNQIRVHLAELGHPVLGDPRYRPERATHRLWPHRRLALHAEVLGFTHPVTGKPLRFEAPAPAEFVGFCRRNRVDV